MSEIELSGAHGKRPLPSTEATARDRANRIRMGIVSYVLTLKDISDAYHQRDWATLGYAGWDAYVVGEFNEERLQLPRDKRERAVADLREAGLSTRAIASALGVGKSTVDRDLSRVPSGTPAGVSGIDGKQYAATQPERKPEPDPLPPPHIAEEIEQRISEKVRPTDSGALTQAPVAEPPAAPSPGAGGSASRPSPAVTDYLADDQDAKDISYVRSFLSALQAAGKLALFDAERVGLLLDETEFQLLRMHAETVGRFSDKAARARRGLRVIEGGRG